MKTLFKALALILLIVLAFLAGMEVEYLHTQYGFPKTISITGGN